MGEAFDCENLNLDDFDELNTLLCPQIFWKEVSSQKIKEMANFILDVDTSYHYMHKPIPKKVRQRCISTMLKDVHSTKEKSLSIWSYLVSLVGAVDKDKECLVYDFMLRMYYCYSESLIKEAESYKLEARKALSSSQTLEKELANANTTIKNLSDNLEEKNVEVGKLHASIKKLKEELSAAGNGYVLRSLKTLQADLNQAGDEHDDMTKKYNNQLQATANLEKKALLDKSQNTANLNDRFKDPPSFGI